MDLLLKMSANKLAKNENITIAFKNLQAKNKTKLFDYENVNEPMLNNEKRFRIKFIFDQAIKSIEKRFMFRKKFIPTILDFYIVLASSKQ